MDHSYKIPGIESQIEYLEKRLARAEEQMRTTETELRKVKAKLINLKIFLGTAFVIATEIVVFTLVLHIPGKK